MYWATIPLLVRASRTLLADELLVLKAIADVDATFETVIFNRTASGFTFTVPVALTLIYRSVAALAEAGTRNREVATRAAEEVAINFELILMCIPSHGLDEFQVDI